MVSLLMTKAHTRDVGSALAHAAKNGSSELVEVLVERSSADVIDFALRIIVRLRRWRYFSRAGASMCEEHGFEDVSYMYTLRALSLHYLKLHDDVVVAPWH